MDATANDVPKEYTVRGLVYSVSCTSLIRAAVDAGFS